MIKVKTKEELRTVIKKQEIPLQELDISEITDISYVFYGVEKINGSISNWDVSNVMDMSYMFEHSKFNQPIGDWDVSNVRNMRAMFLDSPFNQPIGDWDVSNVRNMSYMFTNSNFNQPIGDWDVSSVRNMKAMFSDSNFNQDISNWDISHVESKDFMFVGCEHEYYKENCGEFERTIYLNHIDPTLIHIGCFVGTKEEAIKKIKEKYKGAAMEKYIQDVKDVFEMYEKEY